MSRIPESGTAGVTDSREAIKFATGSLRTNARFDKMIRVAYFSDFSANAGAGALRIDTALNFTDQEDLAG